MKKVLIISGILVGIGALAWYLKRQANLLMEYCFNFVGYKITTMTRDRITIELQLQIKNKSDLEVTINSYDFSAYLNGAYITKVRSKTPQKIAPKGFSVLSLLIDVEPRKNKDLANWAFLSRILFDINNITVKISGGVNVSALGISPGVIPVNVEMKLKQMVPDSKNPSPPCI
jgi:LEA14-like dessication related protein